MKRLWRDDMKRRILKACGPVIVCNIKTSDTPFWWSHVYWIYLFLHMLNYSCVNSYLFNRIPWLLVSHITSLYLLSNKDVIRAIYIIFLFLFMQLFFIYFGFLNEATPLVGLLGCRTLCPPVSSSNKTDRYDIASCYRFSCYYRFSDIAINSVNPSFIWRLEFSKNG
jgi:hypothetical protein